MCKRCRELERKLGRPLKGHEAWAYHSLYCLGGYRMTPHDVEEASKIVDALDKEIETKKVSFKRGGFIMDKRKVKYFTGRLDKLANFVEQNIDPELAARIDNVSDALEKQALWESGDADERRYMDPHYKGIVWQRDADEPYTEYFHTGPGPTPDANVEVRERHEGPIKDWNAPAYHAPGVAEWRNPKTDPAVKDYHWASKVAKSLRKLARELEGSV